METGPLQIDEQGRAMDGSSITSDRRLFMQFLSYGGCQDESLLAETLTESGIESVLYRDINDPQGIGLLTLSDSPDFFIDTLRPVLNEDPFRALTLKPEYTMFGRTYTIGYETDLDEVLLERPRRRVFSADEFWAVWYPLRRAGSFEQLPTAEQREILMEHGRLGSSFGEAGYAVDIRLACHGIDKHDNDFVIGLLGKELHPLSALVQAMRKTQQTSKHLTSLGPFFVGKVFWQSHPVP